MGSSVHLCVCMLAWLVLLMVTLDSTRAAPSRQRRELFDDDLSFEEFMDGNIGNLEQAIEKEIEAIEENMGRMKENMDTNMQGVADKYNLGDLPPNYSKSFGQVEDINGTKVITNTTITKQMEGDAKSQLFKQTKTSKGDKGSSFSMMLQSSYSKIPKTQPEGADEGDQTAEEDTEEPAGEETEEPLADSAGKETGEPVARSLNEVLEA